MGKLIRAVLRGRNGGNTVLLPDTYERQGAPRKVYGFTAVLCYSRMRFVTFVKRCDCPTMIRCLMEAFEYFGGLPKAALTDRMKSVLLEMEDKTPRWNARFADFMASIGVAPRICKPYKPQTKGKVERSVGFVKQSFWAGVNFTDIDDLNRQAHVCCERINSRVHRTTHERPRERREQEPLSPLPADFAWERFATEERKVGWDGYLSYDGVLYGLPSEARVAGSVVQVREHHGMLSVWAAGQLLVEFVDRPMSYDPHDQLLLQIRGAVSEYERSLIAERMRRGRRQKYLAAGLLPWTRAPYGYRVDPAHPRDPSGVRLELTEAAVVAELFSSYLQEGASLKAVTQHLSDLGVASPNGKTRWNQATIRGIFTNPVYTGTVSIGRSRPTEAQGRHSALVPIGRGRGGHVQTPHQEWIAVAQVPVIISQEQFDQVQVKLAHNQQFARRNNTAYPYLLRAMVSCGTCRLGCIGRSSRGGYAYYVCCGKSHGTISHRDEKCPARSIPVEQLDELVWQDVCEILTHPNSIVSYSRRSRWR